MLGSYY